jgi:hypothetical protein
MKSLFYLPATSLLAFAGGISAQCLEWGGSHAKGNLLRACCGKRVFAGNREIPSSAVLGDYNEKMKKKEHDWLEKNPAYAIKPDLRVFFKGTPFNSVIPAMWRQLENERDSAKP